jgi:putative SOS response-associated peptidase YedK
MCGRFTLRTSAADLAKIFELLREPNWVPRYNIAPTQSVLAVHQTDAGREGELFRWGLIPSWAKNVSAGSRMINARAETIAEKPSFRAAFKRRRCLILADGFFEWEKLPGLNKQPYFIGMRDRRPFAFAGLWEHWQPKKGSELHSCTIITGDANGLVERIHDRMPVILPPSMYDVWLDPAEQEREKLQPLLVPYPADEMWMYPVSTLVNNPRNENPACVEPAVE